MSLASGGHLTHGHMTETKKISSSSLFFESCPYFCNEETGIIDYDALEEKAKEFKPGDELIIAEGPFAGYEATLFSQNSEDRIIVLLKIAEKYIKIDLNQEVIEKNYY